MNWLLIGLLTAITASSQTPMENAQRLNDQGNRAGESGIYYANTGLAIQWPVKDPLVSGRDNPPAGFQGNRNLCEI